MRGKETRKTESRGEHQETVGEEIASSITHGIGIGLGIAALSVLVVFAALRGDAWRVVSFAVYGATLVLLYSASTFYHAFQKPKIKRIFRIFEHSAIYILIAGTYTPFTLVSFRGGWGWSIFGVIWGLALFGIVFKAFFVERFEVISTIVYVLMGWLVLIAIRPVVLALPVGGIVWLVIGGASYTLGVVFFAWDRLPFNHAIWHLFVLGGSICHFFAILLYVLPMAG